MTVKVLRLQDIFEHIRGVLTSHSRHLPDLFLPALTLSPTLQLSLVLPLLHLSHLTTIPTSFLFED